MGLSFQDVFSNLHWAPQHKLKLEVTRTHRQTHRRHASLCRFGQTSQWECVWEALWSVHQTPLILLCACYKIPHTGHWQVNDSLVLSHTHTCTHTYAHSYNLSLFSEYWIRIRYYTLLCCSLVTLTKQINT